MRKSACRSIIRPSIQWLSIIHCSKQTLVRYCSAVECDRGALCESHLGTWSELAFAMEKRALLKWQQCVVLILSRHVLFVNESLYEKQLLSTSTQLYN